MSSDQLLDSRSTPGITMASCMHLTVPTSTRLQPRRQFPSTLKCRSSPLAGLSTRQKSQTVNMIGTMPPGGGAGPPGKATHMFNVRFEHCAGLHSGCSALDRGLHTPRSGPAAANVSQACSRRHTSVLAAKLSLLCKPPAQLTAGAADDASQGSALSSALPCPLLSPGRCRDQLSMLPALLQAKV